MTISNYLPPVYTEGRLQCEETAQESLSAAEAAAANLDLPCWEKMAADGIYRCSYVIALRTQALRWKVQAIEQAAFTTWRYSETARTLFVQVYAPGQTDSLHLRGEIQDEGFPQKAVPAYAAIDIMGNGNLLQVGQRLGPLGEQWADWRLVSLEVAEEAGF